MKHWLMKSEPDVFSLDDLARLRRAPWDGVRNYQARNFMRDQMKVGDLILFYHSSCKTPGVAGLARVSRKATPDLTQWDPKSEYFDPRATRDNPIWMNVEVEFVENFPRLVTLSNLHHEPRLKGLMVLKRGSRLSIQQVQRLHYEIIQELGSVA